MKIAELRPAQVNRQHGEPARTLPVTSGKFEFASQSSDSRPLLAGRELQPRPGARLTHIRSLTHRILARTEATGGEFFPLAPHAGVVRLNSTSKINRGKELLHYLGNLLKHQIHPKPFSLPISFGFLPAASGMCGSASSKGPFQGAKKPKHAEEWKFKQGKPALGVWSRHFRQDPAAGNEENEGCSAGDSLNPSALTHPAWKGWV